MSDADATMVQNYPVANIEYRRGDPLNCLFGVYRIVQKHRVAHNLNRGTKQLLRILPVDGGEVTAVLQPSFAEALWNQLMRLKLRGRAIDEVMCLTSDSRKSVVLLPPLLRLFLREVKGYKRGYKK